MTYKLALRYIARICWNTKDWIQPSGDKKGLERLSYVATHGFGAEEWLLNSSWLLDGFHYAFLEPVRPQDQSKGMKEPSGALCRAIGRSCYWAEWASRYVDPGSVRNRKRRPASQIQPPGRLHSVSRAGHAGIAWRTHRSLPCEP